MKTFKPLALATFCAMTLGLGSQFALAQDNNPAATQGADPYGAATDGATSPESTAPSGAVTPGAAEEVSDSQLALYAKAAVKVEEIRQDLQEQMPQAESTEEAQLIQEEGMQRMVSAVESFGMTVEEYNQIATAVLQSPDMQSRLQQHL